LPALEEGIDHLQDLTLLLRGQLLDLLQAPLEAAVADL